MKNFSFFTLLLFFLAACNTNEQSETVTPSVAPVEVVEPKQTDESVEAAVTPSILYQRLVLPEKGGTFRGNSFNMLENEVKSQEVNDNEAAVLKDDMDDAFIITTDLGGEPMNFADITYEFDELGLSLISLQSFIPDSSLASGLFDKFIEETKAKYGDYEIAEDGFYEFVVKDGELSYKISAKNIVEIKDAYGMIIYFYNDIASEEAAL